MAEKDASADDFRPTPTASRIVKESALSTVQQSHF